MAGWRRAGVQALTSLIVKKSPGQWGGEGADAVSESEHTLVYPDPRSS